VRTFTHGLALPLLNKLSETTGQYGDFFAHGVSPIPAFLFTAVVIWMIWSPRLRRGPADHVPRTMP
jgi:hypothetical protein